MEHHDKKDATCTEIGWDEYDTCKRAGCGYTTYQEIPALGHKYSQDWSNDKTYHWHASTCGHDVVSDKGKHTFDSNWVCTECAYVDTGLHGIELRTNTLELDGTDIYGKVSNSISTFSFINEIAIADSATYIVSTDISGSNVIRTKTVSLGIGDNTFYILVENGKDLGLYTVVIRRRPMYSVSFNVNGGTSVSSQTIEEDYLATEPTTERKGYTFDKWDYDFSKPIIKDTTITASWNIITYNVYYDLNVPSDSISQDVDNSMNVTTYTVEDAITFQTPSRKGYRLTGWDKNIEKGTIGDVMVTASWEAIEYDIVYDFGDADSVSKATNNTQNPSKYTIENTIIFVEPSRDGYTFVAWDKNIVRGTIDTQTITASWEIIEYDIVYDFGDTDSVSKATNNAQNPSKYTIENTITFAEPSRTGYTFISWDKNIVRGTIDTQIITASWEIIEYDIIYDFGDTDSVSKATNNGQNPSKYTIEDAITFEEPSRGYYTFSAWNIDKIVPGTTETQTIVASWIAEQHTITYILSNGWTNSKNNITAYTIEDKTITLYDAIKGESLFCGWHLDEECKNYIATIDASTMRDYMVYAYADDSATKGLSIEKGSVKGYSGTLTDVVIPPYYKGYKVTSIGDYAFRGCSGLTSIKIPNSVTSIGDWAFCDCSGLTSVTIGNSVTSIGDYAFSGCYRLVEVYNKSTLSITAGSDSNGDVAYYAKNVYTNEGGSKLTTDETGYVIYTDGDEKILVAYTGTETELILPSYITKINRYAFYGCISLTSVTIRGSVTSIGDYAFSGCSGLTSITIPDSVTSIGSSAFSGCSSLESMTIPFVGAKAGVTSSDTYQYPFGYIFGATSYTGGVATLQYYYGSSTTSRTSSTYYIPSSLKSVTVTGGNILLGAFDGCKGLTSITIPGSVNSIGEHAFDGCSGLTSITIPDSVTSIGDWAFGGCSNLATVTFVEGSQLETIGFDAFYGCRGLTSITIPDSVTGIGHEAFYDCRGLTSVTIPNSVTSIGGSAFSYCDKLQYIYITDIVAWCNVSGLDNLMEYGSKNKNLYINNELVTSITIPNSVTSIGNYAFYGCSGLTSVTIGNSVTSIGNYAFYGCSGLTSVTIGNSVTSIGDYAFSGCYRLVEVYNKSTLSITAGSDSNGDVAYYAKNVYTNEGGSKLTTDETGYVIYTDGDEKILVAYTGTETELILPSYITKINRYAFYGCTSLTSVTIGGSVTSIGNYAFYGCSSLTSITIPDSVTSIGSNAFYGCSGLTSVTIGNSVTSIGEHAFCNCTGLTSITIPDSVTSIGARAFYGCSGLTSITIPDSVTSIANSAFSGCSGLTSVTIPNSVTSIANSAFSGCSGLTSITIGSGVTSIGFRALDGCSGLTRIDFNGTKAQWEAISKEYDWNSNTGSFTIYCTDGTI